MKTMTLITAFGVMAATPAVFAVGKENAKATHAEIAFIMKAADGGMTEVELGKVAEKNGQKEDVKSFGSRMVKDHRKANDDLKSVASKLGITIPAKISAKHQTKIKEMSKMNGAAFDAAYAKDMVEDHEKDIAEFEKARGEVGNEELKKFIDDTVPVMKEHLEMAKKMRDTK